MRARRRRNGKFRAVLAATILCAGAASAEIRGNLTDLGAPETRPAALKNRSQGSPSPIKRAATDTPASSSVFDPRGWRAALYRRALAEGIDPRTFAAVMNGNAKTKRANFPKSPYSLVLTGRWMHFEYAELIDRISRQYQVDKSIILGIWGIETHFGRNMGGDPLGAGMVKYAAKGKGKFAQDQLLAAMLLVKASEVDAQDLVGSFAGAMGHTQFIPSSYLAYAVDGDGDQRRDLWSVADALASTANYLHQHGWRYGEPWGAEVILPSGLRAPLSKDAPRTGYYWNSLGVRLRDGGKLPFDARAPIIAVGGRHFLIYHNFAVIRRYNLSDQYVVDVGELGDLVTWKNPAANLASATRFGSAPTRADGHKTVGKATKTVATKSAQPADEKTLEMQERLKRAGFYQGALDGIAGPQTARALGHFQRVNKLRITGRYDEATARALMRR